MPKAHAALEFTPEEFELWIKSQQTCKFDGEVYRFKKQITTDLPCMGFVSIQTKQENGYVFIHENYNFGGCVFDVDPDNIPEFDSSRNDISVGKNISGIMNPSTKKVLYLGKISSNAYPEIPVCEGQSYLSTLPYVFSFPEKLGLGMGSIIVLSILIFIAKKYLSKKYKHKK